MLCSAFLPTRALRGAQIVGIGHLGGFQCHYSPFSQGLGSAMQRRAILGLPEDLTGRSIFAITFDFNSHGNLCCIRLKKKKKEDEEKIRQKFSLEMLHYDSLQGVPEYGVLGYPTMLLLYTAGKYITTYLELRLEVSCTSCTTHTSFFRRTLKEKLVFTTAKALYLRGTSSSRTQFAFNCANQRRLSTRCRSLVTCHVPTSTIYSKNLIDLEYVHHMQHVRAPGLPVLDLLFAQ